MEKRVKFFMDNLIKTKLNFDNDFIYDMDNLDIVSIEKDTYEYEDGKFATVIRWIKSDKTFIITDTYGSVVGKGAIKWYGIVNDYRGFTNYFGLD